MDRRVLEASRANLHGVGIKRAPKAPLESWVLREREGLTGRKAIQDLPDGQLLNLVEVVVNSRWTMMVNSKQI